MKTIGMIGGLSWQSTAMYYRMINETVERRLGGHHSARILLSSLDFEPVKQWQYADQWEPIGRLMVDEARRLEQAGADFILITSNTMHKFTPDILQAITIPFLHIADPTGAQIQRDGHKKIGLLGTRYTMEHDFYRQRLIDQFGLEVVIPAADDRTIIQDTIYNELTQGKINPDSRQQFRRIVAQMAEQGVTAVILGCTEIMLLLKQEDASIPLYDTTQLHAEAAAEMAIA